MPNESINEYGAQFAARYEKTLSTPYTRAKTAVLASEAAVVTPKNGSVLDIGGNVNATVKADSLRTAIEGHYPEKELVYRVMDVSGAYFNAENELSELAAAGLLFEGQIPGVVGDVVAIPLADHSTDTVIAADVLEHIIDLEQALKEVRRVLKEDGTALVIFPAMYSLNQIPEYAKAKKKKPGKKATKNTSHEQFLTPSQLKETFESNGFSIERTQGVDFLMGLLFLTYTNPDFVPNYNPKTKHLSTREANEFMTIRRDVIGGRQGSPTFNIPLIDSIMNHPRSEAVFRALLEQAAHPLDVVPLIAGLDPAIATNPELAIQLEKLKGFVEAVKPKIDAAAVKEILRTTPFAHWANSVFVMMKPKISDDATKNYVSPASSSPTVTKR